MPMPYTPAAVEMIRFAANGAHSRAELREMLGWDDAMIDRVCVKHNIDYPKQQARAQVAEAQNPIEPVKPLGAKTAARKEAAAVKLETRRREAKLCANVTVTFGISQDVANAFLADISRRKMTRSAAAGRIITSAVDHKTLDGHEPVYGARAVQISIQVIPSVFDALCAKVGAFGSMSALCGAILHRHYAQSNAKRSARQ